MPQKDCMDTRGYQQIPRATNRYRELPTDTESYQQIPRATNRYLRIPEAAKQIGVKIYFLVPGTNFCEKRKKKDFCEKRKKKRYFIYPMVSFISQR